LAVQAGCAVVNEQPLVRRPTWPGAVKLPRLRREFLYRAGLVAIFVTLTHQFRWEWLRFLTSEAILRISASLGVAMARVSFDTIRVQGQLFQFVIACTFVDVSIGSIPLLWDLKKPLLRNVSWVLVVVTLLFSFNLLRLEMGYVLYARGLPWTVADGVLGGFAYFAVWLFIWSQRTWELTYPSRLPCLP
jgi:exosortase/archaeosortase